MVAARPANHTAADAGHTAAWCLLHTAAAWGCRGLRTRRAASGGQNSSWRAAAKPWASAGCRPADGTMPASCGRASPPARAQATWPLTSCLACSWTPAGHPCLSLCRCLLADMRMCPGPHTLTPCTCAPVLRLAERAPAMQTACMRACLTSGPRAARDSGPAGHAGALRHNRSAQRQVVWRSVKRSILHPGIHELIKLHTAVVRALGMQGSLPSKGATCLSFSGSKRASASRMDSSRGHSCRQPSLVAGTSTGGVYACACAPLSHNAICHSTGIWHLQLQCPPAPA